MSYIKTMLTEIVKKEPFKSYMKKNGLNTKTFASQTDQIVMSRVKNTLRAISHEAGQYDSFHFTTAVFDEIGEVKTRAKISKIISGQVKVHNHQFIQISTAYPDPTVPFHDDEQMLQEAMEKDYSREADTYLCLIWAQDSLEETYDPETWIKSNPLLGLESEKKNLMDGLQDKRNSDALSGTLNDFQNKNLNLWLQQSVNSYLKLADVERAIIPQFDIDGRQVYIGFDYSMFSDNTAIAFVYSYRDKKDKQKWFVYQHSFILWMRAGSIEAKEKQDGINYRELARRGFCTITSHPQGLINEEQVYQWLVNYVDRHNLEVVFFGYDTFGATPTIKQLELNSGWPLEAIRQRTSELKDPTKFLQTSFVVDAIIDALYQGMYHFEDYADVNNPDKQIERMTDEQVLNWFNDPKSGLLGGDDDDI